MGATQPDCSTEIVVRASGTRVVFDETIGLALEGRLDPRELSSRTAPAAMLHQLAESLGGGLQFALSEDALVLGAVLPGG